MSANHRVWTGSEWIDVLAAESGGEAVVVPNVAAIVFRGTGRDEVLMQRRDKEGEVVRGRLELPGGRWRAGELPDAAVAREVREETGIELLAVSGALERRHFEEHISFSIARPVAVVTGADGAYPSLHVLFECRGDGDPRPVPGETASPRWWRVEELLDHLRSSPEDFVWHTRAMLAAYFGD